MKKSHITRRRHADRVPECRRERPVYRGGETIPSIMILCPDPLFSSKNNAAYYYPINHERPIIGKFCSIACGAKFPVQLCQPYLKNPYPLTPSRSFMKTGFEKSDVATAWD